MGIFLWVWLAIIMILIFKSGIKMNGGLQFKIYLSN